MAVENAVPTAIKTKSSTDQIDERTQRAERVWFQFPLVGFVTELSLENNDRSTAAVKESNTVDPNGKKSWGRMKNFNESYNERSRSLSQCKSIFLGDSDGNVDDNSMEGKKSLYLWV